MYQYVVSHCVMVGIMCQYINVYSKSDAISNQLDLYFISVNVLVQSFKLMKSERIYLPFHLCNTLEDLFSPIHLCFYIPGS